MNHEMSIASLRNGYLLNKINVLDVIKNTLAGIGDDPHHAWIHVLPLATIQDYVAALQHKNPADLPLYGIPFAIKDNIDLAGAPTTAGCAEYAYTAAKHATVVQRLIDAGAIPIGKTNLDQFATGLNGTRSPYGACRNAINPDYISGGSSAGSAVSVALGQVSFSLGTDTAGSGRVPAAFNNLVGVKPTRGWLSTSGVVPACRSLDCVTIFAHNTADAATVLAVAAAEDDTDIYSRAVQAHGFDFGRAASFRFGVPQAGQLQFFGNQQAAALFQRSCDTLRAIGGVQVEIDFAPFLQAARLLYEGPWVAERYAAIQEFFDSSAGAINPVVREIIGGAKKFSAADTFNAIYKLEALRKQTQQVWHSIDCLLTPTAGTIYTQKEMLADPIGLNSNLGYYTNFMNMLDYAAIAVPAGFQEDGLPFGITLAAPAHQDIPLLHLAEKFCNHGTAATDIAQDKLLAGRIRVAVCGAHLAGLPLNHQLTARGAHLLARTTSSADYKLYALPGGPPYRPGMVRIMPGEAGSAIEVEVWEMAAREFGSFVAGIPAPLGIGTITLASGETVQGFVCEQYAVKDAVDISHFGGWRSYLQSQQ
ncbi:MAG: allophanate hydrolase [Gallionellales bacterium 35-53-114]|jgi:allophanate hydrolase|nr:MAG: allophanate hydrolase [Gallionellales bacterium 35-53-114]OYZ63928.1 MAG: allophanate hydrolase [Gallionellales bacterium 24-53-125]OZB09243.1 MAG: allophanate hydrolase [Gallionellales bacterium 39-52-133]HQS59155.1 allophanate hydrolase [Gallionellaceae bacterium]HQS75891.1 allophanate hydrolase [Gallionellaceae bacterium]